ncbi:ABC transporter ATP-binding protein [Dehalococcoides mccartyi]|uniref:ABC transporter ATP-binding protein n=2 Tax=Dehalococcoidaceae TaxID=1202464 RepID=A0A142VAZ7_9CHLR|nr:ABC transporter ATP-binding protein [Dehalococcoides mccartyi]AMU86829.1 ABC transporter ATP-binding protein [Dehalococcoides mccartyi]AOV99618.1 ABC-type multidrug/protein/lipid transport system, ATPase component [Dehalococcoides mccartyi]MBA2085397.1 Efflux ABC transporter, permease/ATP-binding protein [Dehalococcoides mccartyi]QBX64157.1 ABC transporter ATP-binding protein [Dehalococcoides mccartyi]BEL01100.1 ABC transporter ATP-binding protein [Dehalococcoides mccartyi]
MSQNRNNPQSRMPVSGGPMGGGMHMGGGPMGGMRMAHSGEKARNFKDTMTSLLKYLTPYRFTLIIALVLAIFGTVFTIIGPKLLGNATTKLFEGLVSKVMNAPGAGIDFTYIGNIVLILVGLYAVSAICSYIMGYIMTGVSIKVTYDLRKQIAEKINRLPMKFFDNKTHGEVLSHVTNDVDLISNTLTQSMSQMVTSVVTILGVLVMMFTINWIMALASLIIVPVSIGLISLIVGRSQKYFRKQQDYLGHINGHVEEMYSAHNVMKAFNGEEKSITKFEGLNEELYGASWKSQFLSSIMMPMMNFIGNLSYVVVCILGGFLAIQKTIQVGDILAFVQYVRSFTQPLAQTANIVNVLQSTAAAAERIFEFLGEGEEVPEPANPVSLKDISGAVSFKDVSFGYSPTKVIIKNFNADIKPGQRVAIVGPTGAGKTTMVKLLMRFYDVNSGAILVDGVNIQDIKRQEYRSAFGMVLQDTWLFNGSIMDNIRFGKLDATDDEVYTAAKTAYIDHFIHTLPNGYEMVMNEESSNISQGQKQLLTIARAVLANPKILILDEATSSVDTRTEMLIQQAMENLMQGRTAFIIAHRLSTIRNADIILVMKDGAIVEQGNHKELLEANGFYASLYNSQFESGLIENN